MRASHVMRSITPLSVTLSKAAPPSVSFGILQSSTPAPLTSLLNPFVPVTYLTPTRTFSSHSHSLKCKHQPALVKQLGGRVRYLSSKDETVGQDDQTPMTKEDRDQALQQVPAGEMTGTDKWIRRLGWLGGFYSRRQVLLRSTRKIYLATCDHTHDSELYDICGLPDTFQSWFLVQQLHIWMLMVRSKADGSEGKQFHKSLVQFFWDDVEHRMTLMRVEDVTIKTESNRELNSMFYGLLFAYDEGIAKGDQVLAAAVWRNLFHASKSHADMHQVSLVVDYIRRELAALDELDSSTFLKDGTARFSPVLPNAMEATRM